MAVRYFGAAIGAVKTDVEDGASSHSTDMEFAIDDSNSPTKMDALLALDAIRQKIIESAMPG